MCDLKKVEEKFIEFLKSGLKEERYDLSQIKLTEELFDQEEAIYVPFGYLSYFLVMEDEKPVVYVNFATRMGSDRIYFVDENGYEMYDEDEEMRRKFNSRQKNVKHFRFEKNIMKDQN